MWKRRTGIRKAHFYSSDKQVSLQSLVAMCGVSHLNKNLVDAASTGNRCTMCQRELEKELGIFA